MCQPTCRIFNGHSVLDKKNVDKWGAVRREVAMAMCDEHKREELKMYCEDHDMVCCIICMSDDHRSCKAVQHVPIVAKGIHQMEDFKKLPSDISNMIQQLSNMQDSREKTHQLLLDACQNIISSLNELRKKWIKLMDEIQKRTIEQMNQLFAAMDVNIQSDKDTCKAKQDELKSLLEDIQTKGKKSETLAFSGFKKSKVKLSAAEGMLQSMTKQDFKLTFTPDTSIEHCLSTMSTFGELTKTDHIYTVVNKQQYNVSAQSDKYMCEISGSCTLPDGNTVIVDNGNSNVKLLNNQYHIQDHCDLPDYPRDICHIADSEVAVTVYEMCSGHKIQFIDTGNGKLSLTRCVKLNHDCIGLAHHAGQLYVGSITALYIHTMTGQLVKKLYEDTSGRDEDTSSPDTVYRFAVRDDGRRVCIADSSHQSLLTLDNTGNKLATLNDPDVKDPAGVQVSHDCSVFVCSYENNTVIQAAADGTRTLATLVRQADGINRPVSLCLDRKSSTLIIGQANNNEILVMKIK